MGGRRSFETTSSNSGRPVRCDGPPRRRTSLASMFQPVPPHGLQPIVSKGQMRSSRDKPPQPSELSLTGSSHLGTCKAIGGASIRGQWPDHPLLLPGAKWLVTGPLAPHLRTLVLCPVMTGTGFAEVSYVADGGLDVLRQAGLIAADRRVDRPLPALAGASFAKERPGQGASIRVALECSAAAVA